MSRPITIVHIVAPGEHCQLDQPRCVVCKWRTLPDDRAITCHTCPQNLDTWLEFIEAAAPLLAVVAATEPTTAGTLNLDAVDLTQPGNPAEAAPDGDDQIGYIPIAGMLAPWFEAWSGRDIITADAASVARQLRRSVAWACRYEPQIDVFAHEVRHAFMALRVALKRDVRTRHYGAPCSWCGHRDLKARPGAKWIECDCGALYDEDDYARLVITSLQQAARERFHHVRQPLTTREAAALAGVSVTVIRQWATRGRIWRDIGPWGKSGYLRITIDRAQAELEHRTRTRAVRLPERIAA